MVNAIGFLELSSIAKGVEAADAILKAAESDLIYSKATCPGKYTILFKGDVAAVKSSLDAGLAIGGPTHLRTDQIISFAPWLGQTACRHTEDQKNQ